MKMLRRLIEWCDVFDILVIEVVLIVRMMRPL